MRKPIFYFSEDSNRKREKAEEEKSLAHSSGREVKRIGGDLKSSVQATVVDVKRKTEELKTSTHITPDEIKGKAEEELKSSTQITASEVKGKAEEELKSSTQITADEVKGKAEEELKSSTQIKASELKGKAEEELKSSTQLTTGKVEGKAEEELKSSTQVTAGKRKVEEVKSSIETSLTDSSFSMLVDCDKEDNKKGEELSIKDDNDIVVIDETPHEKSKSYEEIVNSKSGSLAHSLPSLSNQPPSTATFEVSSLEAEHDKGTNTFASTNLTQSIPASEFPSLKHEKSKSDNGSDIEVIHNDDKSPKSPAQRHTLPDSSGTSHLPKTTQESKKPGADVASGLKSANVETVKDVGSEVRKSSKDSPEITCKDKTDTKAESLTKVKETTKPTPTTVPPEQKTKSDKVPKDHEVHMRHPTNKGEFLSFGMRLGSQDSFPDHVITGVEDGGPASEVGLK